MVKFLAFFITLIASLLLVSPALAANNSYVSVVNPVRGSDFWSLGDQKPVDAVAGEQQIMQKYSISGTFLIRYDALKDQSILKALNSSNNEYGIFFEVTPTLTKDAGVTYHQSPSWHNAASVFLSGYSLSDRVSLIDAAFAKFKEDFGYYPKSVGAWWIDSYSMTYMQQKYGIITSLEVADQYSTDSYQIWGQYWGSPYIPQKQNVLLPAQNVGNRLPLVMTQWAARDPVNGYGNGVIESTYSVQPNDYIDYHGLDINYFSKLLDIYTIQKFNQINQISVGLENSYSWSKYQGEYDAQMKLIAAKRASGQFQTTKMTDFGSLYLSRFQISPTQTIIADDPLGGSKKAVWYMDPFYRAGWFYNSEGSVLRDIRPYIDGQEELCLKVVCNSVNFATSATRVLDDVSFGDQYLLDPGTLSNFQFNNQGEKYMLSYLNQAGNPRDLEFLPRDISLGGKVSSIDSFILNAKQSHTSNNRYSLQNNPQEVVSLKTNLLQFLFEIVKFLLFLKLVILLPGYWLFRKTNKSELPKYGLYFFSTITGIVLISVLSYIFSYFHFIWLTLVVALVLDFWVIFKGQFKELLPGKIRFNKVDWAVMGLILAGVIFQLLPTFRSGWVYDYGLGLWGANGHDGIWHIALANQLMNGLPVTNPGLSGAVLKNYHFLFDMLLAITGKFSGISLVDLLFRFYPVLLSTLLGAGSYFLIVKLFNNKLAAALSLYVIYFSGSFGWIVEFITQRHFGGESAFWANQMVSFNLNPPFAISLVLLIGFLGLFLEYLKSHSKGLMFLLVLIGGSLVSFKSYAGILVIGSLFLATLINFFRKDYSTIKLFLLTALFSLVFIVPNFTPGAGFFVWSPFWLIHSMIDDPDRVGWTRLSIGRQAYLARGDYLKLFAVEVIGLIIFLVGNLGTKVLGAGYLIFAKLEDSIFKTLIIFLSLMAVAIPLLFIQAGTSWNIVQFFYYFMYIAALFSGVVILNIWRKLPKSVGFLAVLFILLLTPINSIVSANMYLSVNPHTFISPSELSALKFLSDQKDGTVVSLPFDDQVRGHLTDPRPLFAYDDTAYISAFSKKSVFLEDQSQQDILQAKYLGRLSAEKDLFSGGNPKTQISFLKNNNIKYIYWLKYFNINLDEGSLNLKKIFDNNEVAIYESEN